MDNTEADTATAIPTKPVGCRYPKDRVSLIDSISGRLGHPDRATTIRLALDEFVERHFPGATGNA